MSEPNPPGNLLGRPPTRYRGTDIDGATLSPEGLWVRGRNLNELIGGISFEDALWHIWFDRMPSSGESNAVRQRLARYGAAFAGGNASVDAAAGAARAGVETIFAAAAGLMRDVDHIQAQVAHDARGDWDDDFDALLACVAGAPYLMRAALNAPAVDEAGGSHAMRVLRAARADGRADIPDQAAERVMNALLVAWHGGFGYITPTVLVPRCAIGTGVTLAQAIAAGFMSSGPNHVGAARAAMQWLTSIASAVDGASADRQASDEAAVLQAVDRTLDGKGALLSGFGHPLFEADPRPPHVRALFREWGFEGRFVRMFDAACDHAAHRKGLKPNIDFVTAAALLDLGIDEPRWGVGVGLCARIAAMAAHAVERRSRPAFGVTSATARKLLAAVPVGWL
ncbi:citrate synthase [Trinickia symbiotica]|uniref:citrate synthase (unknown stereospecificity) n=1 Tax=Trinickia symbiotica TaxID=863227 RepID=A0A2N7X9V9_9BURK|nr:citrate/2-methylcitrate synthase [Trinickia symbiotica]PMS38414.1 citrate/2-methylcitrate synthase [Trinickia symbiotica]PPK46422.1 citrate synthase [Trinickia symbiotica]